MIGITLYRSLVISRPQAVMTPEKEQLSFKLLIINVVLAVAVLFSSGLVSAFAKQFTG